MLEFDSLCGSEKDTPILMGSATEDAHIFVCSGCGERILVDEGMRNYLRAEGCAVCGTEVHTADFERL